MDDTKIKLIKSIKILIGLFISGLGTAFLYEVGWGSAPTSTIVEGVSSYFNISFGLSSFSVNVLFLILLFIFDRSLIGIGTVLAVLFLGFFIDLGAFILLPLKIAEMNTILKLIMLLIGCVLTPIGLGYYLGQFYGTGAIDSMALIIHNKTAIGFKYCRWGTDFILMAIGILLGAAWGIGTLASFILTGPIMQFTIERINPDIEERADISLQ